MAAEGRDRIIQQRMEKRRRDVLIIKTLIAFLLLLIIFLGIILIKVGIVDGELQWVLGQRDSGSNRTVSGEEEAVTESMTESGPGKEEKLEQAARMAQQYDYDGAIALLQADPDYYADSRLQNAAAEYATLREACVVYPADEVPHVFFHTLIKDPVKAFDGDEKEAGYNQFMTTIDEFNGIIQQMYDRGYVMVSLHDMCTVNEDGTVTKGEIRLPTGKIPVVISQDDVSYYHYMDGDGFAEKLIVDENGEVKNTYIEEDGSVSVGDYDMVPLIDTFVKKHPDFAYHGHKGVIALTGYEGVLGYRTDEVYKTRQADRLTEYQIAFLNENPDFDFDAEVAEAKKVADAMKANGWEFASHTWGHINPVAYGYNATVRDTECYKGWMEPVIGYTDILIFAFGADINDWTPYTADNDFFTYFKGQGFNIFCNVDGSKKYWVQFGNDYMRSGRRNLDGYTMYYNPDGCSDLFNVQDVWDDTRTTPVPPL